MLYTEKQVERMIEDRLFKEMTEMNNSRRFDEMHERINGLDRRINEFECRLEEILHSIEVRNTCEKP